MGNVLPGRLNQQRQSIETRLAAEETALAEIVTLLASNSPFAAWPDHLQRLLCAALTEEDNRVEAQKARSLRRHLFRSTISTLPVVRPSDLTSLEHRIAERLRADLPSTVSLGAAIKLG